MDKQTAKFVARVLENLPEMDGGVMQSWIENPKCMKKVLKEAFDHWPQEIESDKYMVNLDANPLIPRGWEVESHVKGGQIKFDQNMVDLYLPDEQNIGSCLEGNKLRERLEGKNPYNANLLDFYLAHPELIPESWKDKIVFFWGTIYYDTAIALCVRCLNWDGFQWNWHFRWLDGNWVANYPSAIMKKE